MSAHSISMHGGRKSAERVELRLRLGALVLGGRLVIDAFCCQLGVNVALEKMHVCVAVGFLRGCCAAL